MISVLLVVKSKDTFSEFATRLGGEPSLSITWADSGTAALSLVLARRFDLVIVDDALDDMTGLVFAEKLVTKNPLVNCAVVSALPEKAFHEASEGLGLLAQLPSRPSRKDAQDLLERLFMIDNMIPTGRGLRV
jgi:CheY-like chemotaxis protein